MDYSTYQNITLSKKHIWQILERIPDPEIPVLSIVDLGIVRDVLLFPSPHKDNGQTVEVIITPTYSGCPAMNAITINIRMELLQDGFKNMKIIQQLSPAWTTEWMTKSGKDKLKAYGIAPPQILSKGSSSNGNVSKELSSDRINKMLFTEYLPVGCPQCKSNNTKVLSQFGSTACKALYQCNSCKEPFDYFKCH